MTDHTADTVKTEPGILGIAGVPVRIQGLSKSYARLPVLKSINLTIRPGEFLT
ncbi:sulfonate ABC transporter ATP-binding protein, partial [Mesorhizobium sanjuanii]